LQWACNTLGSNKTSRFRYSGVSSGGGSEAKTNLSVLYGM
jgi:hypothetical protein